MALLVEAYNRKARGGVMIVKCPYCGCEMRPEQTNDYELCSRPIFAATCQNCYAQGPEGYTRQEALDRAMATRQANTQLV